MAGQLVFALTIVSFLVAVSPDQVTATMGAAVRDSPKRWLSRASVQPKLYLDKTRPVQSTKKTPVSTPAKHAGTSLFKKGLPGPPNDVNANLRTTNRNLGTTGRSHSTADHKGLITGHYDGTTGRVPFTTGRHDGTTRQVPFTTGRHDGTTGRVPFTTGHRDGTTGGVPLTTVINPNTTESENTTNNSHVFYVCPDNTEINVTQLCDGHTDCPDGSDEIHTTCQVLVSKYVCPIFYIDCDNGTKCLHIYQLCDGIPDCADGKDENTCGFKCAGNNLHIPLSAVCDEKWDCLDGSDELTWPGTNCSCSDILCPSGKCISSQDFIFAGPECTGRTPPSRNFTERHCDVRTKFLCDNKTNCRPAMDRCDGYKDCKDGSDEMKTDLSGSPLCNCSSFVCSTGKCVPMSSTCDLVNDCGDFSDEVLIDCTPNRPRKCGTRFAATPFHCGDGTCIEHAYTCDGNSDCLNGEDESYSACYSKHVCPEFTCTNGNCVLQSEVCDGDDDCKDYSDELSCTKTDFDLYDDDHLVLYVALGVFCGVIMFFVIVAVSVAVHRRNMSRAARIMRTRDVRARVAYMTPVFVGPPSYSEAVRGSDVQRKTECSFANPMSFENNTDN